MTVPILILAGGASSRMGSREKLLETVQGQPLLRLQAWRALKASRDVTVLIRPGQPAMKRAVAGLPIKLLTTPEAFEGMGGSIRAGTKSLLRAKCFLMVLGDLVEIETSDMRAVINARQTDNTGWIWRGATEDGAPGHPILFDHKVYGDLLNQRRDTGAQSVIDAHADKLRIVPLPGTRARLDLDTPEQWDAWRESQKEET